MFAKVVRLNSPPVIAALLITAAIAPTGDLAVAGGGAENVMVVVNGDSWASKAVANEFIHLRRIPPTNVAYLHDVADLELVDVETFREQILKVVLAVIRQRGLTEQIDYVVYSSDFPYSINARADMDGRKPPRSLTPICSINGLTYLYQQVLAKDPGYLQLDSNRYMRRRLDEPSSQPTDRDDWNRIREARDLGKQEKWPDAEKVLRDLVGKYPGNARMRYQLACCLARQDKLEDALSTLALAVETGWSNRKHTETDADLEPLRQREEFGNLLDMIERKNNRLFKVQPALGFRAAYRWNDRGEKVADARRQYLLSTMLAVTSGRGNSVSEAVDSLRRSVAADGSCPEGTVYFMVNDNIRSTTRDGAFRSAVAELKRLGVKSRIVEGTIPQEKEDVQGAMIGTAKFDWKSSRSRIMPGAICEHLTSCGGIMREKASQTPLSDFIRYGAAGTSGTVTEPLAIQAKFPFAFMHVHYARGCSLAESFYQSVFGPYQLLIVGDPLCQPWAKRPAITVDGLEAGDQLKGVVTVALGVSDLEDEGKAVDRFELFLDGKRVQTVGPAEKLRLDTTKLADGYHQARVVAVGKDAVESQGRTVVPLVVNNCGHHVELTTPAGDTIPWDQRLKLDARAAGASSIAIIHNARRVARIEGDAGSVELSPLELGPGPVCLHAVATIADASVRSAPVELTVAAPDYLPSCDRNSAGELKDGILLVSGESDPVVIGETHDANWLSMLKFEPGQKLTMTGEFQVDTDDVYQFQLRGNCEIELTVDDRVLAESKTPRNGRMAWQFVPVPLEKGRHLFRLTGTVADEPKLSIRFGSQGAQSLSGKRFRHRPDPM